MIRLFIFIFFFALHLTALSTGAANYYEKAIELKQKKQLNTAEISLKQSIQADKNYLPARLLLGEILLDKGQIIAADKELTIALNLQADDESVVLLLVETKLLQQKYQEALNLLAHYPQLSANKDYFRFQGNAYKALRAYKKSQQAYEYAIQDHGHSAILLTAIADLHFKQNQLTSALLQINNALQLQPDYLPAILFKAQIFKRQKNYSAALNLLNSIISQQAQNIPVLLSKTEVLLAQNKLIEALSLTLTLRELTPHDPYAKLLHASIIVQQGEKNKGKLLLREIQQQLSSLGSKQQKQQEILLLSATIDLLLKNKYLSRKKLLNYINLYGEHSIARRYLATIALQDGAYELASRHIDKALMLSSNDAELYSLAAYIYQYVDHKKQLALLAQAAEQLNFPPKIMEQYIGALITQNKRQTALQLLEKYADNSKLTNKTLLAYMQLDAGLLEQASQSTQTLLSQFPHKIEILQLAGELSIKLGQIEDAKKFFQQSLKLDKHFRPALLALAGLYLNNKQYTNTIDIYKSILKFSPKDSQTLQLYADLAIKQQQPFLAIRLLAQLDAKQIEHQAARRSLLALYMQTNQLTLAMQTLTSLEEFFSLDQELLIQKSQLQAKKQQITAAANTLKILYGLVYDSANKLTKVANLQLDINDISAAKRTIARLKTLNNQEDHYLMARLALAEKNFPLANTYIAANINQTAPALKWLELQVHLLCAHNAINQAVLVLETVFQQSQQRTHLQLLTRLHSQQNNQSAIITLLSSWLTKKPNDTWAAAQLSAIAITTNQANIAIKTLENFPGLQQQPLFLNNLANLYLEKDLSLAEHYAHQAYQLAPNIAAINDTKGWTLVKQQKFTAGLGYLREASARNTKNALYQYHLAFTLAKLDRNELAEINLLKAIKLSPKHALRKKISLMLEKNNHI